MFTTSPDKSAGVVQSAQLLAGDSISEKNFLLTNDAFIQLTMVTTPSSSFGTELATQPSLAIEEGQSVLTESGETPTSDAALHMTLGLSESCQTLLSESLNSEEPGSATDPSTERV